MRRALGTNALSLVFLAFFALALAGQALAGWQDFNNEASAHDEASISLGRYLVSSSFGNAVLENWQSEYLAVGSMASSPSTCASAAPPSPSRSGRPTRRRASRARQTRPA